MVILDHFNVAEASNLDLVAQQEDRGSENTMSSSWVCYASFSYMKYLKFSKCTKLSELLSTKEHLLTQKSILFSLNVRFCSSQLNKILFGSFFFLSPWCYYWSSGMRDIGDLEWCQRKTPSCPLLSFFLVPCLFLLELEGDPRRTPPVQFPCC